MQKSISAIIISLGLIISAVIIVNGITNDTGTKAINRYRLFQGKILEQCFTTQPDGKDFNYVETEDCILRIDTKTGVVDRYEVIITNKKDIEAKNGFYRINN